MVAYKGDEYWAKWARDFAEVASLWPNKASVVYGEMVGMSHKHVSTRVSRLRLKGFLCPLDDGIHLTPMAEAILNNLDIPHDDVVAFTIKVLARSKAEAQAKLWEVELQLESWDPKSGPFRLREPNQ